MKILVIDPKCAGIAGETFLASLIDLLGVPHALDALADTIRSLDLCREFGYEAGVAEAGGITATHLAIEVREEGGKDANEIVNVAAATADAVSLSKGARSRVLAVAGDLAAAGQTAAPVKTIFSVVGTILLLDRAGFLEGTIVSTPPALGGGTITTEFGEIPGPAPATLDILARHRLPFASVPIDRELTTPAGAALLANLAAAAVTLYPAMVPVRVGHGTRAPPERSGFLRVVEGETLPGGEDRMVMLMTNLDDVPGEVVGYAVERLFAEGAADVFVTPASGKKNRPVSVVSVMAPAEREDRLVQVLMEETGTLGVRVHEFRKVVADRKREAVPVSLGGREYPIRVKTSTFDGRLIAEKPEYDDLAAIARDLGIPLRSVDEEVRLHLSRRRRRTGQRQRAVQEDGYPPDLPYAANAARDE